MSGKQLLIRADASSRIGTGHVMRCLALAQAWQDTGGSCIFAMALDAPSIQARLGAEGMRVMRIDARIGSPEDMAQTVELARNTNAAWIVLDGYGFNADYQRAVKHAGFPLLWLDDNGDAECYYADIVLNQNIHANATRYTSYEPYTKLLLGTRYALLRREFLQWHSWRREISPSAQKVLVTLGGGDPENVTLQVVQALERVEVKGLQAIVVVGASNLHFAELEHAVLVSRIPIRLERNAKNIPELMAWADVAISGAGSTCWELAFMGLPSIILVLADNQKGIAEELDRAGVAINLGWLGNLAQGKIVEAINTLLVNPQQQNDMRRLGRELVDGKGAARVVNTMRNWSENSDYILRRATQDDALQLWNWRNGSTVRASSFNSEPIPWETHLIWLERKLNSVDSLILILEKTGQSIGQIRFDRIEDRAEISFSIDPRYRGQGIGTWLLVQSAKIACRSLKVNKLVGVVKQWNTFSIRTFEKAGFHCLGNRMHDTEEGVEFCLTCHENGE